MLVGLINVVKDVKDSAENNLGDEGIEFLKHLFFEDFDLSENKILAMRICFEYGEILPNYLDFDGFESNELKMIREVLNYKI